ncbi:hypothetical protein [Microbacterium sp. p3-SID131]|uniref:hypothetical protein n=1 Tax=Microbacterium sp. p3-SID131 TaxID=2916215 RepID=UPI0021A70E99|nr:hypothetical protein [Microbacterium sp. p3-SID131]MCT1363325.1 hypothetical protein [Microbacterium sp. p3-SID131]
MSIADRLSEAPDKDTAKENGDFRYGPDGAVIGGDFTGIRSEGPLTNWDHVFEKFMLDPELFEIIGDTVRASTWQSSKRTEDGNRDIVNLFSYRASFRRKTTNAVTEADITEAQKRARAWKLPRRIPGSGLGEPVAAILNLSDMQLGKSEGGGIDATLDRLYDGLENFQTEVVRQRKHRNVTELVIVNNGDPFEGIAGNYTSQTHTVQAGLRGQMNLVLDVWSAYARELYPAFDKGQFVSVLCNHTEFGRQGGSAKSITSDSDNGGAFLAETLQRVLHATPGFDHVDFTIPHDEMNVYTTAANVPMGFNHGHKIPGSDAAGFEKWLNGQARGDQRAHEARIWVTAHRHNFQAWDLGSTFGFSCPSCDGGSKWLRDTTGKFSRSGIITFLVGEHHPLGWSDVAFI